MNIYLIAFDLKAGDHKSMNQFLSTLGDCVSLHRSASLLAVDDLDGDDIHNTLRDQAHRQDQWTITLLDKNYTGYSNDVESVRTFMENHPLSFK